MLQKGEREFKELKDIKIVKLHIKQTFRKIHAGSSELL